MVRLMSATSVVAPPEGPFASAMFNTVRGFSSIAASTLVEVFLSHREQFHSSVLINQAASRSWLMTAPTADQATVQSLSDSWLMLTGFAACLLLLTAILPKRVWPPQTLIQNPSRNN
jgi:DHA2 family multidrug resistance protein